MDQLGAPDKDEDKLVTKLRNRLNLFLKEIRNGAEGNFKRIVLFVYVINQVFYVSGSGKRD